MEPIIRAACRTRNSHPGQRPGLQQNRLFGSAVGRVADPADGEIRLAGEFCRRLTRESSPSGRVPTARGWVGRHVGRADGFAVPLILVLALVGVLFGIGRLATFRYQCQMRFDRQQELERVMATRSALRWLATRPNPPLSSTNFNYSAAADRQIGVQIFPVSPIYPAPGNSEHLNITNNHAGDSEQVVMVPTTGEMAPQFTYSTNGYPVLEMGSAGTNTTGQVAKVEIQMESGSWLNDLYGRRYWFRMESISRSTTNEGDVIRFGLTPQNQALDDEDAPAIWLEQAPTSDEDNVPLKVWAQCAGIKHELFSTNLNYRNGRGLQISGQTVSLFEWVFLQTNKANISITQATAMPAEVRDAFLDANGQPREVRLTLEVESRNPEVGINAVEWIRVDPAYEYEVALDWRVQRSGQTTSEMATVVHLLPANRWGLGGKAYTYDTHGTSREP